LRKGIRQAAEEISQVDTGRGDPADYAAGEVRDVEVSSLVELDKIGPRETSGHKKAQVLSCC
jgi:hypothetical protein